MKKVNLTQNPTSANSLRGMFGLLITNSYRLRSHGTTSTHRSPQGPYINGITPGSCVGSQGRGLSNQCSRPSGLVT